MKLSSRSSALVFRIATLLPSLAFTAALHAQSVYTPVTFTTFAGTALTSGSNDGTGTAARFRYPAGVAVDASGTIYVADTQNDMIRMIAPNGVVTTLAGAPNVPGQGNADGTGSAAKFNVPYGIAISSTGIIYVADTHNCTIRKITTGGVVTTLAGTVGTPVGSPNIGSADGTGSAARFAYPTALAVDSTGNIFVCDSNNQTIRKITPAGVVTTFAGQVGVYGSADGLGTSAQFFNPYGLTIDSADNLYVSDFSNNTIRKITPAGLVTTIAGSASAPSGSDDGIGSSARFNSPYGITVDAAGNLYISDQYNHTLRKMAPSGGVSTIGGVPLSSGTTDGAGSSARFFYPAGLGVSASGYLYIADQNNHTIRRALVGNRDHDINADGKSDLIWQNTSTGDLGFWLMDGTTFTSWVDMGVLSTDWHIAANADFNGDGQTDILWENAATGERYLWFMNGATFSSGLSLGVMPTEWHVAAVADFNSDGKSDILWENTATGDRGFWLMNGATFSSWVDIGVITTALRIVAAADFNGDGQTDIVWENTSTGKRVIWLMNGVTFSSSINLGIVATDWHIAAVADYNGDGRPDILWTNTVSGDRGFWLMNGTAFSSWVDLGVITTDWSIAP